MPGKESEDDPPLVFDFDALSNYLIPKQQLGGRCITVNYKEVKVMGVPHVIEGNHYKRNEFVFNVGLVCHYWSKTVRLKLKRLANCVARLLIFSEPL